MKKKIILTLTFVIIASIMISAVTAGDLFDFLNDEKTNTENTDDVFVVGFNCEFPPFGYKDDAGNYIGFDLDLAKEVCKRNNWTFKAQPIIDWNTKEVELNSGVVDCIWSEFTINGRENDYEWSDPYFNNTQVVVVKSDSNINNIDDLKGKTIEVQEGSSPLKTIEENKSLSSSFGQLNQIKEYNTGFMDLDSGACDSLIGDVGIMKYHIAKNLSESSFKILDEPLSYEQYGIGFKKGNTDLRNQVQKTLDEMFKDGTVDKIAENYTDYGIPEGLIHPQ